MSFVTAATGMMEAAAQDLAGIGSTVGEATASAAAPTTGIAAAGADEVSAIIAQLFGGHGQQFQALAARAAAFHEQFVNLLNSGANSYLTTEVANAQQTLAGAVNGGGFSGITSGVTQQVGSAAAALEHGVQEVSGAIANAPAELQALETSAQTVFSPSNLAAIEAPYQALYSSTAANLQSLGSAISANPSPVLDQIISNEVGYAQTIGTGIAQSVQNLPAQLVGLPAAAIHNLEGFNPAALAQTFINNQIGYGQTISTSLQAAAHDFTTGLNGLPASFQTAFSDLAAGNTTGALNALGSGFGNLFLTGFNTTLGANDLLTITPTGTLGDLLPIFSIPRQMAQNFTNLLPAGSIAAHVSQNFTNVVKTVTDLSVTSTASFVLADGGAIDIDTHVGLPLALAIDALGGPVNALNALGSSAQTITGALQTGNLVGAVNGLLDAPANLANGFLNGQTTLPLSISALGLPTTLNIPLDGILGPAAIYNATIPGLTDSGIPAFVTGTPVGGILQDLLSIVPADIAAALGGPLPPVIPALS
jgi:PE family